MPMLDWDEYQRWAVTKFNTDGTSREMVCNALLGLAGEVGELTEKCKKALFHKKPVSMDDLKLEGGDVLYYLAVVMHFACVPLSRMVEGNLNKLNSRYPNGFDPTRAHSDGKQPVEASPDVWPRSPGEELPIVRPGKS